MRVFKALCQQLQFNVSIQSSRKMDRQLRQRQIPILHGTSPSLCGIQHTGIQQFEQTIFVGKATFSLGEFAKLPGFDRVASFHTHPKSIIFSADDFRADYRAQVNGYLSARNGKLLRFDQAAFRASGLPQGREHFKKFVVEVR